MVNKSKNSKFQNKRIRKKRASKYLQWQRFNCILCDIRRRDGHKTRFYPKAILKYSKSYYTYKNFPYRT